MAIRAPDGANKYETKVSHILAKYRATEGAFQVLICGFFPVKGGRGESPRIRTNVFLKIIF